MGLEERLSRKFKEYFPTFFGNGYENNSLPEYIVISCSHNKEKTKKKALKKIIKKFLEDLVGGKDCKSINFIRHYEAKDEKDYVDDNKFLLPLYKDVPTFVSLAITSVAMGKKVSVVGSSEVGLVVEQLNNFFYDKHNISEAVKFVKEGEEVVKIENPWYGKVWNFMAKYVADSLNIMLNGSKTGTYNYFMTGANLEEKLSLGTSIKKGIEPFDLKKGESFAFIPGDIPWAYLFLDQMTDEDIKKNAVVLNLNTSQALYHEGKQLFPRNMYRYFINEFSEKRNWKEPNIYLFSSTVKSFLDKINEAYKQRQGTNLNPFSFAMAFMNSLDWSALPVNLYVIKDSLKIAYTCITNKFRKKKKRWGGSYKTAQSLITWLLNAHTRVKSTHFNWTLVKDQDALHDYQFNKKIVEEVKEKYSDSEYGGMEKIHPFGKIIHEFNPYMKDIKNEIGVMKSKQVLEDNKLKEVDYITHRFNELESEASKKKTYSSTLSGQISKFKDYVVGKIFKKKKVKLVEAITQAKNDYINNVLSQGEDVPLSINNLESQVMEFQRQSESNKKIKIILPYTRPLKSA